MVVQKLKNALKWITPYGAVELSRKIRSDYKYLPIYLKYKDPEGLAVLRKNKVFEDIYKGQRCFILGTGPSINRIDINKLKNEKCIFLSQFYLHDYYQRLNPKYHLFSGIAPHPLISEHGLDVPYFKQVESHIPHETVLFMNYLDKKLIEENGFFKKHSVNYLYFKRDINRILDCGIDASSALYGSAGIPSMALQLALYMGFREIYMVGFDGRNDPETGASYFYDLEKTVFKAASLKPIKNLSEGFMVEENAKSYLQALGDLRILNKFSELKNCKIYNATNGGILEVFDRVDFDSLF